jgi:hypothetical protein
MVKNHTSGRTTFLGADHPNAGVLEITLNGNLVEMLRLAHADKQKPALGDEDGLKQVKLVAGAGFEPATFRL